MGVVTDASDLNSAGTIKAQGQRWSDNRQWPGYGTSKSGNAELRAHSSSLLQVSSHNSARNREYYSSV